MYDPTSYTRSQPHASITFAPYVCLPISWKSWKQKEATGVYASAKRAITAETGFGEGSSRERFSAAVEDDGKGKSRLGMRCSRDVSLEAVFCALSSSTRALREVLDHQRAPDTRSWRDERALLASALREPRTRRRRDGRFLRVELRRRYQRDGLEETRKRMYVLQLSSKNSSISTSAHAALPPFRPCGERPWWFVMMTTASVVQSSSEASGARHRTSTRRRWSPEQRRDGHRARGDPAYAWPPTCRGSA